MQKKILKTIIVLLLVLTFVLTNFIFVGHEVVIAMSEILENQKITTNEKNVEFDVYFKSNGEKKHYKENTTDVEDTLILNVNVKNEGVLNDAKIKIENANFTILKDKVNNELIKNINIENKEIELNQIVAKNNIEIEIPIKFEKQILFGEDYFNRENIISISGKYENNSVKEISGSVKVQIKWQQETDVMLSQEISKYIEIGENKSLLQQNITTEVQEDKLPRENETITVNIPKIQDKKPVEIQVLLNGTKLEQEKIQYDETKDILTITNESKGIWSSSINQYKIIYTYEDTAFIPEDIILNTKMISKLYTKDVQENVDEQKVTLTAKGNIVSGSKTSTKEIYKGYMYASSEETTIYEETTKIEISNKDVINKIQLSSNEEFVNDRKQKFEVSGKNICKQTIINKKDINNLFGENGLITIKNAEGKVLNTINKFSQENENGDIVVNYETPEKGVVIETSAPISVGTLTIKNVKAIEGDTGYTKEKLKEFIQMITNTHIKTNLSEEIVESAIDLLDTKTEATVGINNQNLSVLQKNENVQLLITLKSNNEQYDLYVNPKIELVFPKEMNIKVKNINLLNLQDEIKIVKAKQYVNEIGEQVISLEAEGDQKTFINNVNEGIQISITADIEIEKTTPTKDSKIVMNYINENRKGEKFEANTPIKMNSKYGVLVLNKIKNYNENGDITESLDDKVKEINIESNTEIKNVEGELSILNNYETDITNIAIVGKLGKIGTEKISNESLKATFEMKMSERLNLQGKNVKIYYSENSDELKESSNWKEGLDISKAKAYKIDFQNETIKPGELVNLSYKLFIPEKLEKSQSSYTNVKVYYQYAGDETQINSTFKFKTEDNTNQDGIVENPSDNIIASEKNEKLNVELAGRTGGETLKDGKEVYEGQGIKYIVKLTNNSNEELKNIKIIANQTNTIFYDKKIHTDGWDSITGQQGVEYTTIEENPELKEKREIIESIKPGETIEVSYQFSVKEIEVNSQETTGNVKISGDGIEEKIIKTPTNPIAEAKLKLQMKNKLEEEYNVLTNREYPFILDITNISKSTQENIILNLPVPEGFDFKTESLFEPDAGFYEFVEYKNRTVKLKIPKIEAGKVISIRLGYNVKPMDTNIESKSYHFIYNAVLGNEIYHSNEMDRIIYNAESEITVRHYGSIKEKKVKNGDKLTYTLELENKGTKDKEISISDYLPIGADVQSAKAKIYDIENGKEMLIKEENVPIMLENEDGTTQKLEIIGYNLNLKAKEKLILSIDTVIDTDKIFEKEITNEIKINALLQEILCNSVTYQVEGKEDINPDPEMTYNISGVAWIDENKNGLRETTEKLLSGITVMLLNADTGEIAKDFSGNEITAQTGNGGEYLFTNIKQNEYIVVFEYDAKNYRVTEYQKTGINEKENSDVIANKIAIGGTEKQVAMTETLEVSNKDLENIDAGFVQGEKFDIKLDKYISKVIIQDKSGITVKQYDNTQLAKIELDAKKIVNTNVIVEYKLEVTNEGEVGGYVNELVDEKPQDLEFSSEMNKNWYQSTNGELYSKALSNQIINPGETKELSLTLVKTMNGENTGTTRNMAELNKVSNSYSLEDIDSTPGNRKNGEDDISMAELIISVKTGSPIMYISLIMIIIVIIGVGAYFIKKEVLIK